MKEIAEELMDRYENLEITAFTALRLPNRVLNHKLDRNMNERSVMGEVTEEKHFRNWSINMEFYQVDLS